MLNRIPKSWILLAVFIVSVVGAGAWVFTTPPDYTTNQTGDWFGNTSNNGNNYTADRIDVMNYFGIVVGSYLDSYTCDGVYCVYKPWYASTKIYAKNMSTGKIDYMGTNPVTVVNNILTTLPSNPTNYRKIVVVGSYTLSGAPIDITNTANYTYLDLTQAKLTTSDNNIALRVTGASHIYVVGGIINAASQTLGDSNMRVIDIVTSDNITIDGADIGFGGYYGLNVYQTDNSTFKNINTHNNRRHGVHPGSDTAGRGWNNIYENIIANDNGGYGIGDRGSSVPDNKKQYDKYNHIIALRNGCVYSEGGVAFDAGLATNVSFEVTDIMVKDSCGQGIAIKNGTGYLSDLEAYNSSSFGVYLFDFNGTVSNVVANTNGNGMQIEHTNMTAVLNVDTLTNTATGFRLLNVSGATITNINSKYNPGTGIEIDNSNNVYLTNFISTNNGQGASFGGVKIFDDTGATHDISIMNGNATQNYRNLYVTTSAGTISNISFSNIKATEGVNANFLNVGGTNVFTNQVFGVGGYNWGVLAATGTSQPAAYGAGDYFYNSTSKAFNVWNGAKWQYMNGTYVSAY